jgi:hypothetical protein
MPPRWAGQLVRPCMHACCATEVCLAGGTCRAGATGDEGQAGATCEGGVGVHVGRQAHAGAILIDCQLVQGGRHIWQRLQPLRYARCARWEGRARPVQAHVAQLRAHSSGSASYMCAFGSSYFLGRLPELNEGCAHAVGEDSGWCLTQYSNL